MKSYDSIKTILVVIGCSLVLACGGGGSDDSDDSKSIVGRQLPPDFSVLPSENINVKSSHLYKSSRIIPPPTHYQYNGANCFGDFDGNGYADVIHARLLTNPAQAVLTLGLQTQLNNTSPGRWSANSVVTEEQFPIDKLPSLRFPRKAATADFNNDGFLDCLIIPHGEDFAPHTGESLELLMNKGDGTFVLNNSINQFIGFHHGGAAADIDGDGDIDIFAADATIGSPGFYINDGNANFIFDFKRIDNTYVFSELFSADLYDIDDDGYVDLLYSSPTKILWGSASGYYSRENSTSLNGFFSHDSQFLDYNGDGLTDILLSNDEMNSFISSTLQLLRGDGDRQFTDVSLSQLDNLGAPGIADPIRYFDYDDDGYDDIFANIIGGTFIYWKNSGDGRYTRTSIE